MQRLASRLLPRLPSCANSERFVASSSRCLAVERVEATEGGRAVPSKDTLEKATVQPVTLRPFCSEPLQSNDYFNLESLINVDEMFAARLHFGHKIGTLNDNMKWSLYGERLGICIFDLELTKQERILWVPDKWKGHGPHDTLTKKFIWEGKDRKTKPTVFLYLLRALNFVAHVASRGGVILFITSNRDAMLQVEKTADELGQYSHCRRWQAGTLTNTKQLLGASIRLPDTIVFLSTLTSLGDPHPAILEAAKMTIPTIGVVDSNADPAYLTYLIPANDDTPQSSDYLLRLFKEAILKGQNLRTRQQHSEF